MHFSSGHSDLTYIGRTSQATQLLDSRDFPVNRVDRRSRWSSTHCYVLLPSQLTPSNGACDHFHIAMADPKVSLCGDNISMSKGVYHWFPNKPRRRQDSANDRDRAKVEIPRITVSAPLNVIYISQQAPEKTALS